MKLLSVTPRPDRSPRASWRDGLRRIFGSAVDVTPAAEFRRGSVIDWPLPAARLLDISSDGQRIRRDAADDSLSGALSLLYQAEGRSEIHHRGRALVLPKGAATILDAGARSEISMSSRYRQLLLLVPRALLPMSDEALGVALTGEHPVDALVLHNLQALGGGASLSPTQRRAILGSILALTPATTAGRRARRPEHVRVLRAISYIEREYRDPQLCPEQVAGAQRVSRRFLDGLVAARGSTLSQMIRERRLLEGARLLITQPSRAIEDIATHVGMSDGSSFSRAFRRRYGASPRSWRKSQTRASPRALDVDE